MKKLVLLIVAATAILTAAGLPGAAGPAYQRPLSDFVDAQGVTNLFWPPVPDYVGWGSAKSGLFALVDYAGIANRWLMDNGGPDLGTVVSGSISERPLKDGRAEVSVILHAKKALAFASALDPWGTMIFGCLAPNVLDGATPALAECHLQVVFANTAPGAPLPDLVGAWILGTPPPGFEMRQISFRSNATGTLVDGTPARCIVSQTGVMMTGGHGATADFFPAEIIELHVVGR